MEKTPSNGTIAILYKTRTVNLRAHLKTHSGKSQTNATNASTYLYLIGQTHFILGAVHISRNTILGLPETPPPLCNIVINLAGPPYVINLKDPPI